MDSHTLEIATFRADATPEFITTRQAAMEAIARTCEGFVSSRLLVRDDGALVDEVVWTSRAAAEAAAAQAPTIPEAAAYFGHITEVVSMEHATILAA